jgi:hypothetical protein
MPYGKKDTHDEDWRRYAEDETIRSLAAALESLKSRREAQVADTTTIYFRVAESPIEIDGSSSAQLEAPDAISLLGSDDAPQAGTIDPRILEIDPSAAPAPKVRDASEIILDLLGRSGEAGGVEGYAMQPGADELAVDVIADEAPRELIIQDTPALPVIVRPATAVEVEEMTFEQIVEPIAVELGSAFTRVVDELGNESTIRAERPHGHRARPTQHGGGVSGYGAPARVVRLHPENIERVTERGSTDRVPVGIRL